MNTEAGNPDPEHPGPIHADWNTSEFFERATAEDVAHCLESGADVQARDKYGYSPLHFAARRSSLEVVAALIAAGADPKACAEVVINVLIEYVRRGNKALETLVCGQ